MAEQDDKLLRSCEACGATVYPEHIESGKADEFEGRLLCVHCLKDRKAAVEVEEEPPPIALAGEDEVSSAVLGADGGVAYDRKPTAIRSFGGGPGGMGEGQSAAEDKLVRPLLTGSPNATRCRTFHSKLADAAMAYMNQQINEWADHRDDIEIKFATSCIGVVEGKHADPHLIVTVFY